MRKIFYFIILLALSINSFAQTTEAEDKLKKRVHDTIPNGWRTGGLISINFSQVGLTNWSAGGESSISLNSLLAVFANYKKNKHSWDNSLEIGYGFLKTGNNSAQKTDDKLDFTTKYGLQTKGKKWYYSALLNFKTQMMPGYNYPNDSVRISDFLAPGYLLGGIGMDFKPNDNFSAYISPATAKITIVNDQDLADFGAFGVEKAVYDANGNKTKDGEIIRGEYGAYLRAIWKQNVMENVKFQTRLELFSNYLNNPQNIDVNWEFLLNLKVNKYISATLSTQLLYDDDIDIFIDNNNDGVIDEVGPRVQFKEVIGVGLNYKF
jgi:hypothetical protein